MLYEFLQPFYEAENGDFAQVPLSIDNGKLEDMDFGDIQLELAPPVISGADTRFSAPPPGFLNFKLFKIWYFINV